MNTEKIKGVLQFFGKNPTELIEEAEIEEDKKISMKNRKIGKNILDYIGHLRKQEKSQSTLKDLSNLKWN